MILYENETYNVINACLNVFHELGNGFLEPVYQEALAVELNKLDIPFEREKKIEIFYKGIKLKTVYYADFVCYGKIVLEAKSVTTMLKTHKAQLINYLKATNNEIGLLVNFGKSSFSWERVSAFQKDSEYKKTGAVRIP